MAHQATLSLAVSGIILIIPTISLPMITLSKFGNENTSYFLPQIWSLATREFGLLAAIPLMCAVVAPVLLLFIVLLVETKNCFSGISQLGKPLALLGYRIAPWTMPEVYLLGIIIAYFKLSDFIDFELGPAFWSYTALSIFMLGAWRQFSMLPTNIKSKKGGSSNKYEHAIVWAQLASATILLFPAYLLPVMSTSSIGEATIERTILSGIISLGKTGHWPLAAIVFVASVLVPVFKLLGLSWLLIRRESPSRDLAVFKTRLYGLIDIIGRWSMLDVFLVAFLAGSVHFGELAKIEPRTGIVAFAGVVIFTMLATTAFDPRSLWNQSTNQEN